MNSLTDVYNEVASKDADLEKQAAELVKQAEEEDAAGRIMARGFADELAKLAEPYSGGANAFNTGPKGGQMKPQGGSVASGGYSTGGGKTGGNYDPMAKGRTGGGNAMAASMAGGGSKNPVGTGQKPAAPKPPQLASTGGAPKPPKM